MNTEVIDECTENALKCKVSRFFYHCALTPTYQVRIAARIEDPAVLRQRAKMELVPDPRINAGRPRPEALEIFFADGNILSYGCLIESAMRWQVHGAGHKYPEIGAILLDTVLKGWACLLQTQQSFNE